MDNWLPAIPSVIAILAVWWRMSITMCTKQDLNNGIAGVNKRIDDLKSQMTREHDTLANRVNKLETDLSVKIDSLTERYINHLEHHTKQNNRV